MKTTVVIPNYNGRNYLRDCLTSLLKGSVVPTIIVVDNGSADESTAMVEEEFPMVKLIALPENRGFSAAVNIGIHEAETEYVFLLNNDTIVLKDTIEELEAAMERHPNAFSVAAKMLQMKNPELIDSAGDFYCALGWAFARGKDRKTEAFSKETPVFSACAGAALYRKAILMRIILPIWKILTLGIVRISMDTGTIIPLLLWFFMQEADLPGQDIISSRWICLPGTVSI